MNSYYNRRKTRTVFVGDVAVGGNNPIRIQSMTISATTDTESTVREIEALVNAGCEIVRLTVPTKADCENLKNIRAALKAKNLKVPLVADIHFTPSIAMEVVDFVEKVRINPGNFVDKKLFKVREYTDAEYDDEMIRIEEKFAPLVLKCKERGVAMRIGTNHGSLSDRIMNRYGDTALGMVESAIEFLTIAARLDYHDIILSMKASNTQIMVAAYRLLAKRLTELDMEYPFHLGVTGAGEGEDGRVKSAIGIGTLLEEGIGDTVRVSLTEDSEHEIPVATMLASPYNQKIALQNWNRELKIETPLPSHLKFLQNENFSLDYQRRKSQKQLVGHHFIGEAETVRVWSPYRKQDEKLLLGKSADGINAEGVEFLPSNFSESLANEFRAKEISTSLISKNIEDLLPVTSIDKLVWIVDSVLNKQVCHPERSEGSPTYKERSFATLRMTEEAIKILGKRAKLLGTHLEICFDTFSFDLSAPNLKERLIEILTPLYESRCLNIGFSLLSQNVSQDYKILAHTLQELGVQNSIHLRYVKQTLPAQLDSSAQFGRLLLEGIGDSIQIQDPDSTLKANLSLSYNILQGSRIRTSKTEYIPCPSCGRTLFNIQKTTERIRDQTSHLKGVKIAIMGCIVNGPGEMADADLGYVGTGVGRISLYVGKECVERNIPEAEADHRLIELIKNNGAWVETS